MSLPFHISIVFLISLILRLILTVHSDNTTLHVKPGSSSFKIVLFADLHFGEDAWTDWGPRQDVNSIKAMSTVLDQEHPDFVVYLGDIVTANNIPIKNASLYWDQAISPTRDRRIPWASVFGNHDDMYFEWPMEWFSSTSIPPLHCRVNVSHPPESEEFLMDMKTFPKMIQINTKNIPNPQILRWAEWFSPYKFQVRHLKGKDNILADSRRDFGFWGDCSFEGTTRTELMMNELEMNKLSYSKFGPKDLWPSVSNYVLKLSSANNPESVIAYMYFLDSGGGSYPEVISNVQAEWFNRTSQEINPNSRVPEIIFWHIPSQAYKEVARSDAHGNCVGSLFMEEVAAQGAEMGMMELLEGRSSVKAVFVGHNHGLDWCCPYKKLWLCYARHSGYGGYGNWPRGARILEITQQPFSLKSWIRMEDGHVHSEVLLNS